MCYPIGVSYAESLKRHYGLEIAQAILEAQEKEPTHCLIANKRQVDEGRLLSEFPHLRPHPFIEGAYYYDKDEYDLGKSLIHDVGGFYIQDAAAMMPVAFLDPKPGEKLLDMAAAPGGKTIDAALRMEGKGAILSNDISYPRALELSRNIERLGIINAAVISCDLSKCYPFLEGTFDKVILDAPCSGSAMFRKQKEVEEDWTAEKVASLTKIQRNLLDAAYFYLKEGGTIAYSTCSFSYEEDEGVILDFLAAHPSAEAVRLAESPLFYRHQDLPEAVHLLPHLFEGEGQFICLIRKNESVDQGKAKPIKNDEAALRAMKSLGIVPEIGQTAVKVKESIYLVPREFMNADIWKLNPIRLGLKTCEISSKGDLFPDHHLARAGLGLSKVSLNEAQAKAYLSGATFRLDCQNGFKIAAYESMNLGLIKVVGGIAKNHYPKGLRHSY